MRRRPPPARRPAQRDSRARSRKRDGALLEVRLRASTARRNRARRLTRLALALVLWAALGGSGYVAFHAVAKRFFLENPAYNIRRVEADLDGLFTEAEAMRLAGIQIGQSIFKINLDRAERRLRRIEQVAAVRIGRAWPDTIAITVRQHRPVAWLAATSTENLSADTAWLVAQNGRCMHPYKIASDFWSLPVIYSNHPERILSGDPLATSDLRAALDLLRNLADRPASRLQLRSLDISKGYAIDAVEAGGARITFAADEFPHQLDRLEILLAHAAETGRKLDTANLLPKKYTPVRFLVAASGGPPPADPVEARPARKLRQ